jgi:hypothetical protein
MVGSRIYTRRNIIKISETTFDAVVALEIQCESLNPRLALRASKTVLKSGTFVIHNTNDFSGTIISLFVVSKIELIEDTLPL